MADFENRNVKSNFTALTTTVALFAVIGSICLVGFETMRQLRRLPAVSFVPFWKRDKRMRQGGRGGVDLKADERGGNTIGTRDKLTSEDWEMGHLYHARTFHAKTPSPPMAAWPLAWAYQALKLDDWFYATHTGMDTVVYVRFLRACFYWVLLQTLTTAPILLAIHFRFSEGAPLSDMNSASLSYLVATCDPDGPFPKDLAKCDRLPNVEGRRLLWIHLVLAWYITITWFYTLWWIAKGSLAVRKRWINELRRRKTVSEEQAKAGRVSPLEGPASVEEAHGLGRQVKGDDSDGWRQRTLLVTNLPPTMRDEASVRRYFEEFLRPDDGSPTSSTENLQSHTDSGTRQSREDQDDALQKLPSAATADDSQKAGSKTSTDQLWQDDKARRYGNTGSKPQPGIHSGKRLRSPIQTVVLVRKMNELSSMLSRRQEVLGQLEAAHIKLARSVLNRVGQQTQKMRKDNEAKGGHMGGMGMGRLATTGNSLLDRVKRRKHKGEADAGATEEDVEKDAAIQLREDALRLNDLTYRLARFAPGNEGCHRREGSMQGGVDQASSDKAMNETVWEALADVPRELLDAYQPVTRLSSLFRGQKVPTIDYLLTKLNLLTALVTEMRARPPTSYEPTSTAFVTFRDPRQARMVWRELKSQIVVKVRLAPEVKDLDWERLMRTSFTGDIVRGFGVNAFFWVFTIIWVVPVNLLCTSLFSVSSLESIFPSVQIFFDNNPTFKGFIGGTLPSLIVAILTMCVPELIFQISKRAQGFVTFSALYDECLVRYWKFAICNVVIFFCIGATTVSSIIFQAGRDTNVLNSIAFNFSVAAPFYIAYLILGMGLHTGFELLGFMVPLIQHYGARKASTPRSRAVKTLPRNFNRYYWLPFHILIVSIVFLFALLNPLVIPFALVYLAVALCVFKKNLAFTYFRRFNEKEGVVYFVRLLRFSLDGLLVAQIVILVFFSVTRLKAVYIAFTALLIPLNVAIKLLGTRLWMSQCRALEDDEANALCGIGSAEPLTPSAGKRGYLSKLSSYGEGGNDQQDEFTSPLDARASGRYPPVVLAPQTDSKFLLLWNYVQDKFNANGNDRPSAVMNAQARGSNLNARTVTSAVASVPKRAASKVVNKARGGALPEKTPRYFSQGAEISAKGRDGLDDHTSTEQPKELEGQSKQRSVSMSTKAYRSRKLSRGASVRSRHSEEAPFLSGLDAIACHAPVISQDGMLEQDFEDGELDRSTSMRAFHARERRNGRSASYSTTLIKERPRELGDESQFTIPLEEEKNESRDEGQPSEKEGVLEEQMEDGAAFDDEDGEEDDVQGRTLVRPHAKIRWDDTPDNSARYNNPFYSFELDPFLWLPRDPMRPIDLCDTIEWHGDALVSSQGGPGRVGEWEDENEEVDGFEKALTEGGADQGSETTGVLRRDSMLLRGSEEIEIGGTLAHRLQEAEDAEEAIDHTKSIPRGQMDDYKKAIETGLPDDTDGQLSVPRRSSSFTAGGLLRASSMMSNRSRRYSNELPWARQHHHHHQQQQHHEEAVEEDEEGPEEQAVTQAETQTEEGEPLSAAPPKGMTQSVSAVSFAPHDLPSSSPTRPHAAGGLTLPRTRKGREASRALSQHTAGSTIDYGDGSAVGSPTKRTVSMRRALKAEVLEEEYRRTIKAKLIARKKKTKEDAAAAAAAEREDEAQNASGSARRPDEARNDIEMRDLEAQTGGVEDGQSTIMDRHEQMMHPPRTPTSPRTRREGNMSVASVRAVVSSTFTPRKSGS